MVLTDAALCFCRFLTTTLDFRMISWVQRTFIWSHWNIKGVNTRETIIFPFIISTFHYMTLTFG